MDWGNFFEQTRIAAGVDSFSKLAPLLHITDGAISHYRTGKRVPSAWTVAAALRIQGHEDAEREAAKIMKAAAKSAEERAFWRKLGAAAAVALCAVAPAITAALSTAYQVGFRAMPIMSRRAMRPALLA